MATNNKSKGSLIECVSSKSNPQHSPRNGSQDSSGPDYREDKQRESLPSSTPDSMKLVPCQLCGRQFLVHRLEKHTGVCEKLQKRSRKVFDSSQARAKGTDLEQFLQTKGKRQTQGPKAPSSNWRQKHESFQRTIHQAREVQQVIARGGKLSDLPPPPPEENPDYVPCPHCSRRFAPRAAERHIPKCENIKSKPRPPPARRR
ncbi:hypothetical protein GDO86_015859 [Hymenochirus boettgeri]|uniref:C2HC/C3H-type domain-containing protein n=1 Tax=Hymenochirus boettgeri TaxID=247094 RepID=A0A8T2JY46_9PIPI|nr:hypothetical protein GDO86_015859 [Hymenochirus boettgeri]